MAGWRDFAATDAHRAGGGWGQYPGEAGLHGVKDAAAFFVEMTGDPACPDQEATSGAVHCKVSQMFFLGRTIREAEICSARAYGIGMQTTSVRTELAMKHSSWAAWWSRRISAAAGAGSCPQRMRGRSVTRDTQKRP